MIQEPTLAVVDAPLQSGSLSHQRLIRLPDVLSATGMSRAWVYDAMSRGVFPKPLKLGERAVAWRESDIIAWQGGLAKSQ